MKAQKSYATNGITFRLPRAPIARLPVERTNFWPLISRPSNINDTLPKQRLKNKGTRINKRGTPSSIQLPPFGPAPNILPNLTPHPAKRTDPITPPRHGHAPRPSPPTGLSPACESVPRRSPGMEGAEPNVPERRFFRPSSPASSRAWRSTAQFSFSLSSLHEHLSVPLGTHCPRDGSKQCVLPARVRPPAGENLGLRGVGGLCYGTLRRAAGREHDVPELPPPGAHPKLSTRAYTTAPQKKKSHHPDGASWPCGVQVRRRGVTCRRWTPTGYPSADRAPR